jgi:hypothetical protein
MSVSSRSRNSVRLPGDGSGGSAADCARTAGFCEGRGGGGGAEEERRRWNPAAAGADGAVEGGGDGRGRRRERLERAPAALGGGGGNTAAESKAATGHQRRGRLRRGDAAGTGLGRRRRLCGRPGHHLAVAPSVLEGEENPDRRNRVWRRIVLRDPASPTSVKLSTHSRGLGSTRPVDAPPSSSTTEPPRLLPMRARKGARKSWGDEQRSSRSGVREKTSATKGTP